MRKLNLIFILCIICQFSFSDTSSAQELTPAQQKLDAIKAFDELVLKAKAGDLDAANELNWMFYELKGQAPFDENWYSRTPVKTAAVAEIVFDETLIKAKAGNTMAQYNLGRMYANGRGVKKDEKEALIWFTKAAEQGYVNAEYELGSLQTDRFNIRDCNNKLGIPWLTKAAEKGHREAQFELGLAYDVGNGVVEDDEQAIKWLTKALEQGHPAAPSWLANIEAPALMEKAHAGDAKAQYRLGYLYAEALLGSRNREDIEMLLMWYNKAAAQGNADAQTALGYIYFYGDWIKQDYAQALSLFTKAATQGDALGQYTLGRLYNEGKGVEQDYDEVFRWFTKAAEQGMTDAQYQLGMLYQGSSTTGIAPDYKRAFMWLVKAAEQGHVEAQFAIGQLYEDEYESGDADGVVTPSQQQAYVWYSIAVASEDASDPNWNYQQSRERTEAKLTPKELDAAKLQVVEFQKKIEQNKKIIKGREDGAAGNPVALVKIIDVDAILENDAPSFDCRKASNTVERHICASGYLSKQDVALADAFKRAKAALIHDKNKVDSLTASQKKWAKNRQFCFVFGAGGEKEGCIQKAYDQRIQFLTDIISSEVKSDVVSGPLQPFDCELFGSWQVHWDKSNPEDAKVLLEILLPDVDGCWQQLNSEKRGVYGNRAYYARNLMQLSMEAGMECKNMAARFDGYMLSQEKLWSMSTDYVGSRLKCLPEDALFAGEIQKKAESLRVEDEALYKQLSENKELNTDVSLFIERDYKDLQKVFASGSIGEKLTRASYFKHSWSNYLSAPRGEQGE